MNELTREIFRLTNEGKTITFSKSEDTKSLLVRVEWKSSDGDIMSRNQHFCEQGMRHGLVDGIVWYLHSLV